MNLNDELRLAIKRAGVKQVAAAFGVSDSVVHKWGETGEHHRKSPAEDFLKLMEVLKWDEEFMRYLCGRAGGCFVKDPPLKSGQSKDLMSVENGVMGDFGLMLQTISRAARNNSISLPEARGIRKRWDATKSLTEGFVVGCENGNFDAYRAHASKINGMSLSKGVAARPQAQL